MLAEGPKTGNGSKVLACGKSNPTGLVIREWARLCMQAYLNRVTSNSNVRITAGIISNIVYDKILFTKGKARGFSFLARRAVQNLNELRMRQCGGKFPRAREPILRIALHRAIQNFLDLN